MTMISRELTTLEYIILGVLSLAPQSGYSIVGTLENGVYRWRASPGAIYPALKRLEQNDLITSELEVVTETLSRKVYRLTPAGEELIDRWIMAPPTPRELLDEHNIMLVKFLFAEARLTREQVLVWLDEYEKRAATFDAKLQVLHEFLKEAASPHQRLIYKSIAMERVLQRRWIKLARQYLLNDAVERLQEDTAFASALESLFQPSGTLPTTAEAVSR
jgi:DNA-binding PadR family transcriptional regulator